MAGSGLGLVYYAWRLGIELEIEKKTRLTAHALTDVMHGQGQVGFP